MAIMMTSAIGWLFNLDVINNLALLAVGAIVAVAVSQFFIHALSIQQGNGFMLRAFLISLLICTAYFTLHHFFDEAVLNSVLPVQKHADWFDAVMLIIIVVIFAGLLLLQQAYKSGRSPIRDAFYVHLYNGFYVDVFITRMIQKLWPATAVSKNQGELS